MSFYSPIFPPGIEPARPGLYLTSHAGYWDGIGLHRWDGKNWYDASGRGGPYHLIGAAATGQSRYWRGLATQTKEGPTP